MINNNNAINKIPLALVGCDFRIASSCWRSKLVLEDEEADEFAQRLLQSQVVDGFVDLNTCNRNEWIVSSHDPRWAAELLRAQMIQRAGIDAKSWIKPYVYWGEHAARHVFQVAIGRESLVEGERQIATQLYRALEKARNRGTSSRILNILTSITGRLVRTAHRRGYLQNSAVGVHSLAISYLFSFLSNPKEQRVAVIGLGQIGRRVAAILEEQRRVNTVRCNRTVPDDQSQRIRPLTELDEVLDQVDAAIVCTSSMTPIIDRKLLARRLSSRPLLLIDIGVPEQAERTGVPEPVRVAGLDELVAFQKTYGSNQDVKRPMSAKRLLDRSIVELKSHYREELFSFVLDALQRNHRQLIDEAIPELIAQRLPDVPETVRGKLECDLRSTIQERTNQVFRSIKEIYSEDTKNNL